MQQRILEGFTGKGEPLKRKHAAVTIRAGCLIVSNTLPEKQSRGSQVRCIGVQLVAVVRLGALEDDKQHDEHAGVDKVADALHAEGQHNLHSSAAPSRRPQHSCSGSHPIKAPRWMPAALALAMSYTPLPACCYHSILREPATAAELALQLVLSPIISALCILLL